MTGVFVANSIALRRIAKPLIRPSGTFSPPSRGEGLNPVRGGWHETSGRDLADRRVPGADGAVHAAAALGAVPAGRLDEPAPLAVHGRSDLAGPAQLHRLPRCRLFLGFDRGDADLFALDAVPARRRAGRGAGAAP